MTLSAVTNIAGGRILILYENLVNFLQRNGTYFLNKPRIYIYTQSYNSVRCFARI